ncbi:hypothetical protein FRC17_002486 [Serendipita sp. 399]|nr:hypothetical protein FRC17_002486 [Serendipita sp. 399]
MNPFLLEDVLLMILAFSKSLASSEHVWRQELRSYALVCSELKVLAQRNLFQHLFISTRLSLLSLLTEIKRNLSVGILLERTETVTFSFESGNALWRPNARRDYNSEPFGPNSTLIAMRNLIKALPKLQLVRLNIGGDGTRPSPYVSLPEIGKVLGPYVSSLHIAMGGGQLAMPKGDGWSKLKELRLDGVELMIDLELEYRSFRPTYSLVSLTATGIQAYLLSSNLWALRSSRESLTHLTLIPSVWSSNYYTLSKFVTALPNIQSLTVSAVGWSAVPPLLPRKLRELRIFNLRIEAWCNLPALPVTLEHLCLDLPSDITGNNVSALQLLPTVKTLDIVVGKQPGRQMKAAISEIACICDNHDIQLSSFIGEVPRSYDFPPRRIHVQYHSPSPSEHEKVQKTDLKSLVSSSRNQTTTSSNLVPLQSQQPTHRLIPIFNSKTIRSLPKHDEGIPMLEPSPNGYPKRSHSPTKSMNRIPVGSTSQTRVLTELSGVVPTVEEPNGGRTSNGGSSSPSGFLDPPSPGGVNRRSLSGGNTTKVLADLQAGVMHARQALENTRSQLRLAQRSVAQLTRQNEDLKDGRERLRLQNENLNNVVSRKERLLQEVLERARKAETEAAALKAQMKSESANQKKALREMEVTLTESTALSERSQREYVTLKDSVTHLQDGWRADVEALRSELQRREEVWKKEIEEVNAKYEGVIEATKTERAERTKIQALKEESRTLDARFEEAIREELSSLKAAISETSKSSDEASSTAQELSNELARIRRLMRMVGPPKDDPSEQ